MVLILFKMENAKEGGSVNQPMIIDGAKNHPTILSKSCKDHAEDDSEVEKINNAVAFMVSVRTK